MAEVAVLAEHRNGVLRDVTLEMLSKGREIANKISAKLIAILIGHKTENLANKLRVFADKVIIFDKKELKDPNAETHQQILSYYIKKNNPILTLIGHTSFGIDLAPALAVELEIPLATDCIDLYIEEEKMKVTRQMYGGKLNVSAKLRKNNNYIATVRPATFEHKDLKPIEGEIISFDNQVALSLENKKFIEYIEPQLGEVDITQAEILLSIGRGIKDEKNIDSLKELSAALKAEIGCSRPIVDKGWLPKERQVGSSGKTVKPKLYIAAGISGSFQHVMGMKNADLIFAINRDPKAPIFRIADYGIAEDMFKIVPSLIKKINEFKQISE